MAAARNFDKSIPLIGCVATNQQRKELALWGEICAGLAERLKGNVRLWLHVDVEIRHWNVPAIVADFGIGEMVEITTPPVDDSWLAQRYRECAVTFLPSGGEGFGYPLFESLACGTPVVHGDYAGGASLMASCNCAHMLVTPHSWRVDGIHNCVRPVYRADEFVEKIVDIIMPTYHNVEMMKGVNAAMVRHLGWDRLGQVWRKWFKEGL